MTKNIIKVKKVSKVMIQESDENIIRNHLLGYLTEEGLAQSEQRMLADDDYFELLTAMEDELIDDYVNNDLTGEDRKQFEIYFLSSAERRDKLIFAQALRNYVPQPTPVEEPGNNSDDVINPPIILNQSWWKQAFSSPYLGLAAAAAVVIGVGIVAWLFISPGTGPSKGIAALNKAYSEQRPGEARITEFDYAPPPPVTRGPEQEKFDYVARDRAKALIQLEAEEHPDARSYHDLGRLYLTQHEFDKARDQFERALTLDDKNAQVENDLGVALMERGKTERPKDEGGNSLEDFARALEHFNKALELNGSLLEALFNRALCRQEMELFQQAEEDWRAYLAKDPVSKWAGEARERLRKIEEQKQKTAQNKEGLFQDFFGAYEAKDDEKAWKAFSRCRSRTGNYIVERLLDTGLNAGANNSLQLLSYAGDLEVCRAKDFSTSHIAAFYASTTPNQRAALAQTRSLIKLADEESSRSNYKEAVDSYSRASKALNQLGDDCEARYAEYRIAQCSLRQNGAKSSLGIFERLAAACKSDNHKWLLALTYTSLADAYDTLGEYSKGLDYTIQALKTSEEIEDTNGVARCHLQIAISYRKVKDYRKSLAFLQSELFDRDSLLDISLRWVFYDVAAEVFKSLNLYVAAIDYQKEALRVAMEMGTPLNLSRSYAHLGFMYGKLKKYDEAIEIAERAYEVGKDMSDEAIGREMMAYSSLYLGDLRRQKGDYAEALTYYDQNINLYDSLDFPLHRYATHKGKLLCFIALRDDAAAKDELETTLNLFEQYRSKILEENSRNSFFDIEQNIYDTAIDFDYSRMSDRQSAFEKSENSRARSLLDLADKDARMINEGFGPDLATLPDSQPLRLEQIQARLPERSQILQYAMLEDKLLIWVVNKKDVLCEDKKIELADLGKKIDSYLQVVLKPSEGIEETTRKARELYDLLIKPVESDLDKQKYLCIVPDKALSRLPFGALVSESGSYIVSDYLFGICPSSTMFIKRSETARSKEGAKTEKLLAVGNPDFDRATFRNLPSSDAEAKAVAAIYNTSALTGSDARENLIKREMRDSDVIHLSTHYLADKSSYLLSAFLLAQEPGKQSQADGKLQVWEIYAMKLSRLRLAVLAACQTGVEKTYQGEGAISVARPFIAAGVPVVVASLWSVESDSTSKLMISFHSHRKHDPSSTSEALCLAQREMIAGPNVQYRHPYYWAPFAVIGGYTTF